MRPVRCARHEENPMQGKTAVRVLARDPVLLAVVAVVAAMAC